MEKKGEADGRKRDGKLVRSRKTSKTRKKWEKERRRGKKRQTNDEGEVEKFEE